MPNLRRKTHQIIAPCKTASHKEMGRESGLSGAGFADQQHVPVTDPQPRGVEENAAGACQQVFGGAPLEESEDVFQCGWSEPRLAGRGGEPSSAVALNTVAQGRFFRRVRSGVVQGGNRRVGERILRREFEDGGADRDPPP